MTKTKLFLYKYIEGNELNTNEKLDAQLNEFILNQHVNTVIDTKYSLTAQLGADGEIWVCHSALLLYT